MLQKVSFSPPAPCQVFWGWSKSSTWADGGAGQGGEGADGGHGHIGCTLQDGEKASGQHMGVNGALANPCPCHSWAASTELGPWHSSIRGSHPSRTWVGAGQGAAVAPGDGVDHQEVEYPQPGHPQVYFPPWGWAGGKAWAPLPHSTLLLLSCGVAFADSCEGRCEEGFDAGRKCQCDTLCVYYQSCCSDYSTVCKAKGTVPMATLLGTGEWGGCGCSTLWGLCWVSSAPACVCRVKSAPGLAAAHGAFGSWLIAIWSVESMLIG